MTAQFAASSDAPGDPGTVSKWQLRRTEETEEGEELLEESNSLFRIF